MKRSSSVTWQGSAKEGRGQVSSQSKLLLNAPYGYATRFENQPGTNPEELIAAAHASCFSMKLSFMLKEEGFSSELIEVTSTVTLDNGTITESHLDVQARVPGISNEKFDHIAERTKNECPVSRALNMKITMQARLMGETTRRERSTI